jgi:hypothetical protein
MYGYPCRRRSRAGRRVTIWPTAMALAKSAIPNAWPGANQCNGHVSSKAARVGQLQSNGWRFVRIAEKTAIPMGCGMRERPAVSLAKYHEDGAGAV